MHNRSENSSHKLTLCDSACTHNRQGDTNDSNAEECAGSGASAPFGDLTAGHTGVSSRESFRGHAVAVCVPSMWLLDFRKSYKKKEKKITQPQNRPKNGRKFTPSTSCKRTTW